MDSLHLSSHTNHDQEVETVPFSQVYSWISTITTTIQTEEDHHGIHTHPHSSHLSSDNAILEAKIPPNSTNLPIYSPFPSHVNPADVSHVYACDGSCQKSPKKISSFAVICCTNDIKRLNDPFSQIDSIFGVVPTNLNSRKIHYYANFNQRSHTNNVAELTAMGAVFQHIRHRLVAQPGKIIVIKYDSKYAHDAITGKLLNITENIDLIARVQQEYEAAKQRVGGAYAIVFLHTRAHQQKHLADFHNVVVDTLAKNAITRGVFKAPSMPVLTKPSVMPELILQPNSYRGADITDGTLFKDYFQDNDYIQSSRDFSQMSAISYYTFTLGNAANAHDTAISSQKVNVIHNTTSSSLSVDQTRFSTQVSKSWYTDNKHSFKILFSRFHKHDEVLQLYEIMQTLEDSHVTPASLLENVEYSEGIVTFLYDKAQLLFQPLISREQRDEWYYNTSPTGECLLLALYQIYQKHIFIQQGNTGYIATKLALGNKKTRDNIIEFILLLKSDHLDPEAFGYEQMGIYLDRLLLHFRDYQGKSFPQQYWEANYVLNSLKDTFPPFTLYHDISNDRIQYLFHHSSSSVTESDERSINGNDIISKCIKTPLNLIFQDSHYFVPTGDLFSESTENDFRLTLFDYAVQLYRIFLNKPGIMNSVGTRNRKNVTHTSLNAQSVTSSHSKIKENKTDPLLHKSPSSPNQSRNSHSDPINTQISSPSIQPFMTVHSYINTNGSHCNYDQSFATSPVSDLSSQSGHLSDNSKFKSYAEAVANVNITPPFLSGASISSMESVTSIASKLSALLDNTPTRELEHIFRIIQETRRKCENQQRLNSQLSSSRPLPPKNKTSSRNKDVGSGAQGKVNARRLHTVRAGVSSKSNSEINDGSVNHHNKHPNKHHRERNCLPKNSNNRGDNNIQTPKRPSLSQQSNNITHSSTTQKSPSVPDLFKSQHKKRSRNIRKQRVQSIVNGADSVPEREQSNPHYSVDDQLDFEYVENGSNYSVDYGDPDSKTKMQWPLTASANTWWCDMCRLYEYNHVTKRAHKNRTQHREASALLKSAMERAEVDAQEKDNKKNSTTKARYYKDQLPSDICFARSQEDSDDYHIPFHNAHHSFHQAASFYPEGMSANTILMDISWEHIGALFALDNCPRFLSKSHVKGLQTAYNLVFQDIKATPNDDLQYKKLALLPIILNFNTANKVVRKVKMTFANKLKHIMERQDWSIFTLSLFKGRLRRLSTNFDDTSDDIDTEIQKISQEKKLAKFMKDFKHTSLSTAYARFLSDAVMAPSSTTTFQELKSRFPQQSENIPKLSKDQIQEALKNVKDITSEKVLRNVQKLKRGKAASICTLYAEHIQQLTDSSNSGDQVKPANTQLFIDNLTWLMNAILRGLLPDEVIGWYGSTEGNIILPNPTKRRPISKPTIFSKIFDSIMHHETAKKIESHVKDIQFGASKFSCEKLSHVMRTGMDLFLEWALMSLDSKDAFNLILRLPMLGEIKETTPELYVHNHQISKGTKVFYHGSNEGVQSFNMAIGTGQGQGGSTDRYILGHYPFAKGIQDAIEGNGIVRCIIDDTAVLVHPDYISTVLQIAESKGKPLGIHHNINKLHILLPDKVGIDSSDEWVKNNLLNNYESLNMSNVKSVHHTPPKDFGIELVGVPFSRDSGYIDKFLNDFLEQLHTDVTKTLLIPNCQIKYTLLRYCIVSRITYLMRTLPYHFFDKSFFQRYDVILTTILADIAMVRPGDIDDISLAIAKLHISDGGLSLFYAEDKAIPAFVASYTAALPDIKDAFPKIAEIIKDKIELSEQSFYEKHPRSQIPDTLLRYFSGIDELAERRVTIQKPTEENPNPDIISLKTLDDIPRGDIILNDLQRRFSYSIRMKRKAQIEEHLKNIDGQRYNAFISGQGFHASAWCDVVPRHSTFVMDNDAFAGAIRRRIQTPEPHIYNGLRCTCTNQTPLDRFGYHAQLCSHLGAPRINTHNQIQHEWMKLCRSAKYKVRSEVLSFKQSAEAGFDYTRSDIVVDNPIHLCHDHDNCKLVLDVVITNASKAPYHKIKEKGEEAEAAAKGKCDKLAYKCIQHGYKFSPISFETQGQWSKDTKCLFKSIISQISSNCSLKDQKVVYASVGILGLESIYYIYIAIQCPSFLNESVSFINFWVFTFGKKLKNRKIFWVTHRLGD
jgi:ribonuclease HI